MPSYPNLMDIYPKYLNTLRETFVFREKYQEEAKNFMNNLKIELNYKNPTFVSIHVRRTDHKFTFNGEGDITANYYSNAMKLARNMYEDVIFIVVSDDLDWCKDNLEEEENLSYTNNTDSVEGTGMDLALLAACNHTVVSHGTFGFWGSVLSGGDVIAPQNYIISPQLVKNGKVYFVNIIS